jgi:hypothetical protein
MNSCEIVAYISATACAIAKNSTQDELSLLASIFSQLGDTLATIAAADEICVNKNTKKESSSTLNSYNIRTD